MGQLLREVLALYEDPSTAEASLLPTPAVTDPLAFIRAHAGVSDLSAAFDYSQAQVDLISVVPGRIPRDMRRGEGGEGATATPPPLSWDACDACRKNHAWLHHKDHDSALALPPVAYGLQRCQEVLQRNAAWLPRPMLPSDTLIIQPTSIGDKVAALIDDVLEHLMPETLGTDDPLRRRECWRLVWPSRRLIKSCFLKRAAAFKERRQLELLVIEEEENSQPVRDEGVEGESEGEDEGEVLGVGVGVDVGRDTGGGAST